MTMRTLIRAADAWSAPLIVFLLPWGARLIFAVGEVEALTRSLFALEVLAFLGIALALLAGPRPLGLPARAAALLLAFLCWMFASTLWAPVPDLALQAGVRILAAALLFLLIVRAPERGRVRDAFLLAAALQAALGLWQLYAHEVVASTLLGVAAQAASGPSSVLESAAGRLLRAYGTLPHPNVLGGMLAVALVLALGDRRQGRAGLVVSGLVPLLAAGLMATFSRSAWLAAAAGALALVATLRADRRLLLRLAAAGAVVAVSVPLVQPYLAARLTGIGRLEVRSIDERALALQQATFLVRDAPLRGVGVGNTVPALVAAEAPLREPPHAVPAVLLTELGAVGLLLGLAFLLSLVPRPVRPTPVALALAAASLPLLLLDHYLWTAMPGVLLGGFLLAAVARPAEGS